MCLLAPGETWPLEAVWLLNGTPQPGAASLTIRRFVSGVEQGWTGTAWTSPVPALAMTDVAGVHRYLAVTDATWEGYAVQATMTLTGLPDLTDEATVDASIVSRATPADVQVTVAASPSGVVS